MTITFELDYDDALGLRDLIAKGMGGNDGADDLISAIDNAISSENERRSERQIEQFYGGSGPLTERERQVEEYRENQR